MSEKKKVSEAQKRVTAKYEKENYDKVLVRFPKGIKDKILETGAQSVNGFVVEAVQEKLERVENISLCGTWLEHKWAEEDNGLLISNYECSECHTWKREKSEFCPECGKRMNKWQENNIYIWINTTRRKREIIMFYRIHYTVNDNGALIERMCAAIAKNEDEALESFKEEIEKKLPLGQNIVSDSVIAYIYN